MASDWTAKFTRAMMFILYITILTTCNISNLRYKDLIRTKHSVFSCLHTTTEQHPQAPSFRGALGNAARRCFCSRLNSSPRSFLQLPPFTSWVFQPSTCSLMLSQNRCKELCHRSKIGFGTGQRCCCMFFPGWTNQQQWWGWTGLLAKEERWCQTQRSCRV